jgi:hypothetical protein
MQAKFWFVNAEHISTLERMLVAVRMTLSLHSLQAQLNSVALAVVV